MNASGNSGKLLATPPASRFGKELQLFEPIFCLVSHAASGISPDIRVQNRYGGGSTRGFGRGEGDKAVPMPEFSPAKSVGEQPFCAQMHVKHSFFLQAAAFQ